MPPKKERKSKKTAVEEETPTPAPAPAPAPETTPPPPVVPVEPKKRGKKQPKIVAVVTPEGIQGSFQSEPRRPLIAHLQVNPSQVNFFNGSLQYDPNLPNQPLPYEPGFDNYFSNQQETLENKEEKKGETEVVPAESDEVVQPVVNQTTTTSNETSLPVYANHDLMKQFRDTVTNKKLPSSTDIACYWCSHAFQGTPCIIPEREELGTYRVYGNFCCPECAVAYLLEESLDSTTRWERMALLHRIYGPFYNHKRIFPAPARVSLKLFGGPMNIGTYRATMRERKVRVDVQIPPMVSILGSLDTKPIDFYDSSLRTTFSPLLQESLPKAEENLRLKRSKPLKDKDSTLDSVMNIQIRVKRAGGATS
jgi:hypothetical protein